MVKHKKVSLKRAQIITALHMNRYAKVASIKSLDNLILKTAKLGCNSIIVMVDKKLVGKVTNSLKERGFGYTVSLLLTMRYKISIIW